MPQIRPRRPVPAGAAASLAAVAWLVVAPHPAAADHDASCDEPMTPLAPALSVHGFADVTASYTHTNPDSGNGSHAAAFELGQVDLFLVSHLGENLSFLSEIALEEGEGGESKAEVERVFIRYARSDQFHLSVGRVHTALGYWNEAFHHGRILQPTVDRPAALQFEDDGGILPVHAVGVEAGGSLHAGDYRVDYIGNIANGRGARRDQVQTGADANADKAVDLKVSVVHDGAVRVIAGPVMYLDEIPADPGDAQRAVEIDEAIYGGHLAVLGEKATVIGEFFRVRHRTEGAATWRSHTAWYALASLDVSSRVRPYAMVDRLAFAPGDPYFAGIDTDATTVSAGVRFNIQSANAVKLEYRHSHRPTEDDDALLVQTAFSF